MRINGDYQEILVKLCKGNIGALNALCVISHKSRYAPAILAWFDHNEIYGEDIYLLWNDISNNDLKEFEKIYFEYMNEELSIDEIKDMIQGFKYPYL
jgi:hypothetical protein